MAYLFIYIMNIRAQYRGNAKMHANSVYLPRIALFGCKWCNYIPLQLIIVLCAYTTASPAFRVLFGVCCGTCVRIFIIIHLNECINR